MKIDLINDVHLEFGTYRPSNPNGSRVLVISGDVIPIARLKNDKKKDEYRKFFERCSDLYEEVVYVYGNHEFYGSDIHLAREEAKERLTYLKNIRILDNEAFRLDDVVFLGGTMWTDCNREDPMTMMSLSHSMNDFNLIKNRLNDSYTYGPKGLFTPTDSVREHKEFKLFLSRALYEYCEEKCVVVTHHSPTWMSVPDDYRYDREMNGGYVSALEEFISFRPQIKVWTYGHTHEPKKMRIGDTVLMNNARGYVGHERYSDDVEPYLPLTFEV